MSLAVYLEQDTEIPRGNGQGFTSKARSRGEGAAALRRADSDAALGVKTGRAPRDF